MDGVISCTAYQAFGQLHVVIVEKTSTPAGGSYRLVANESIAMVETGTSSLADALSQLGVVVWQAAERVAALPF